MSLYLGKIHYWLFDKILWFQGLEKEIENLALQENFDINNLSDEINKEYGERLPDKDLEELIDKSNIHGWLQSKINCAEGRMAAWTKLILENCDGAIEKMISIYKKQGIEAAIKVKDGGKAENAKDIYERMNDFILDGMPCDRVNEVIISEEEQVIWKRRVCVHKDTWEKEGVNVNIFYSLRNQWIKAFVNEINNNYEYIENGENFEIRRK